MHRTLQLATVAILAAVWAPVQPVAQNGATASREETTNRVDIRTWNVSNIYQGWSGKALLGEPVYGLNGQVLGDVTDLIMSPDGTVRQVVVQAGGMLRDDGARYAVPWNAVKQVSSAGIDVPVAEGNLDAYGAFPKADELPQDDGTFRLREMIGNRVTAEGHEFGGIRDVIFDQYDKIAALVAVPTYGAGAPAGPIAFPYNPDYFEKQQAHYANPYPRETLEQLRPFDYDQLD